MYLAKQDRAAKKRREDEEEKSKKFIEELMAEQMKQDELTKKQLSES